MIYAAANDQTAGSLAQILRRAGAVRAMELDINSEWVTLNFYGSPGAGDPHKLLPDMTRDATRYLSQDDRDFFAVFVRHGVSTSWPGTHVRAASRRSRKRDLATSGEGTTITAMSAC